MAEGAPLLREYAGKTCIVGSNPTVSASDAFLQCIHDHTFARPWRTMGQVDQGPMKAYTRPQAYWTLGHFAAAHGWPTLRREALPGWLGRRSAALDSRFRGCVE